MGVLDFLFEGKPPKSVTTYGQTIQNVPTWLSDYTQGIIAKANAVSAEPYQQYQGPRIADFSGTQKQAFDMTKQAVGQYQPLFGEGINMTRMAATPGALTQASQYLTQAGQTAPGAIQQYLNPYMENVTNRAQQVAKRTFDESIMPQLTGKFTSAGQYGSSAHMREANRAARDLTEGLQAQSQADLARGYEQAGQMFQSDMSRLGQLGQASTSLGAVQGDLNLRSGQQLGALAQAAQGQQFRDAAALEAIGQQEQNMGQKRLDLAYQDFLQQRDFPKNQVDWLSNIIRGIPNSAIPQSTTTSQTGPASAYQPSALSQIAALASGLRGLNELGQGG
jgi:hypothetical protein